MKTKPVVIVTGASRGLGAATGCWLAKTGAVVALVARSEGELNDVAQKIERLGGRAIVIRADVSDPVACREAVETVVQTSGGVDALINNAGELDPLVPIARADPQKWRYNLEVNLLGPFYLIQSTLSALRRARGRVINISSGAAVNPTGAWSAYCAAKAGLNRLTSVLAVEEPRVTAIAVRPGVVDTQMQARIRQEGPQNMDRDKLDYFRKLKAQDLLLPPELPARSIAWLSLRAPIEWSGQFFSFDQADIKGPAKDFFDKL